MKLLKKCIVITCLLAFMVPAFSGCSEEGPMEKAGKKMDQAAEDAGEHMDQLADDAKEAAKKIAE